MTDRNELAEHLKFFEELGVEGISRDPVWRTRPAERRAVETRSEPGTGAAGKRSEPPPTPGQDPAAGEAPPAERLQAVREELGDCTRCRLHGGRTNLVFGVGRPDADLMFVGEAPGRDEDRQGEPFVGRAGQLLTKIIEAIDLRREDVYIANVVKCRPPQNRNPERDEVETCRPFLFAQIDAVGPRVIVALGAFAVRTLLDDDKLPISRARGRVYACRGAKLIPTFHPAFLLRSPDRKRDVWEDMKRVRSILRGD